MTALLELARWSTVSLAAFYLCLLYARVWAHVADRGEGE